MMMQLAFCPSIGPYDFEAYVDCDVEWELGTPKLIIHNVLDQFREPLMHNEDRLLKEIGYRLADLAEDDEELLARAVEQADFEREAA